MFIRVIFGMILFLCLAVSGYAQAAEMDDACRLIKHHDFGNIVEAPTQITSSEMVAAKDDMPAYCQVQGYVRPQVGFELRLPTDNWNKRLLMQGCGGFCGNINMRGCRDGLMRSYAVVATNMGHKSTALDGKWAYNNRSAEIDFGYRATHVTAVAAKAIVKKFYSEPPKFSYYRGCSTGGRQGLVQAQQFPDDFDGIIAGAPPMNLVKSAVYSLGRSLRTNSGENGEAILTRDKLPLLYKASMEACDMTDGVEDGIIGNPNACRFDPKDLQCSFGDGEGCLTKAQVEVVESLYAGPDVVDEAMIRGGGLPYGSEERWSSFIRADKDVPSGFEKMHTDFLRYMAFSEDPGPDYDPYSFDFDKDYPKLQFMERLYNAENTDLRPFATNNRKMILYMGLQDSFSSQRLTDYHDDVAALFKDDYDIDDVMRVYLIPGMNHCTTGPGVDAFDWLTLMENWVEKGQAPERIMGYSLKGDKAGYNVPFPLKEDDIAFSRPIEPYPNMSYYRGEGDPNDPSSFESKSYNNIQP